MTTKCKVLRGKCAQKWARQAHLRPTNAKKWAALPPPNSFRRLCTPDYSAGFCGLRTAHTSTLLTTRYRRPRRNQIDISSVDELKQRLIQVWCSLNYEILFIDYNSGT